MSKNRKIFTKEEWAIILPIKQQIRQELKREGVSRRMVRYRFERMFVKKERR